VANSRRHVRAHKRRWQVAGHLVTHQLDLLNSYFCLLTFRSYCWKLVADGVGQRRVSIVVPGVTAPPRRVQHSPNVEQ
jgi:hypothetical protein